MARFLSLTALVFVVCSPAVAPAQTAADAALVQKARAIHDRVITLDTHDDINPENFTRQKNYTQRLDTQVNIPKMVEGGLDASFFIVYVGQGPLTPEGYDSAYKQAIAKFDAVKHLTSEIAPDQIGLALTAADVPRIAKSGKKVALIGIENAYSLGTDIKRVKEFYDRGGRYMSLAHNGHSQFADSNTGERDGKWLHNGLSEMGKQVIAEMNKWGIMVDLSHPSKQANLQAMALSKAPVIASHSAARALADVSRNMDDEQLDALKKNGGVIQTVAFASYIKVAKPDSAERAAAIAALRKEFALPAPGAGGGGGGRGGLNALTAEQRVKFDARGRDRQEDAGRPESHRRRLRQSHRLPRQEDWHRSRRHLVRLRRRRRRHRLERRRRDLQRDAGAGASRLRRRTDRQDVERQPAAGDGGRRKDRQADPGRSKVER
jgi:membrane dipeptidase